MLDRKEAFLKMNAGKFAIEFCTLDIKKKTGGKKESYPEVMLSQIPSTGSNKNYSAGNAEPRKLPNHRTNLTINIVLPAGQIKKIHVPLILKINGEPVL